MHQKKSSESTHAVGNVQTKYFDILVAACEVSPKLIKTAAICLSIKDKIQASTNTFISVT